MARDEELNQRIREVLKDTSGITEKNMFGGVCFLHNGNMLLGVDKKHGLMLRVGPEKYEETLKLKHASEMTITGKPMKGMVFVDRAGFTTKPALTKWIEIGLTFTNTLPTKKK